MVFDEIIHHQIVAKFGIVQGSVLVFRQDVAVSAIFQQEANHICIAPLTSLRKSNSTISTPRSANCLIAKVLLNHNLLT